MHGERLRGLRLAHGLSLRVLAKKVGVSAMAVSKYERGLCVPSTPVLVSLATTFSVQPDYFSRPLTVGIERVEHRNRHRWNLPLKVERRILADVLDQLERRTMLDSIAPAARPERLDLPHGLPAEITAMDQIEALVLRLRSEWHLGLGPVPNLMDSLETIGIDVLTTNANDHRFEGMSSRSGNRSIVVVGTSWPGDRQRFTVAHELGHLVLDSRLAGGIETEEACNRFAGAFLAPEPTVKQFLGAHRKVLDLYELYRLKHKFGLSIAGWSHRALDLGIVPQSEYRRFRNVLQTRKLHKTEPGMEYPKECPRLFELRVYRALIENLVTESKASELLGIQQMDLANRYRITGFDGKLRN